MTGLGDRLKEARLAKGYSLDDLQALTKIQKRYLSGIENEDYSMMPGSFYARAFIKQYAEAVGLDAEEMLSLYKESVPEKVTEEQVQIATPITRKKGLRTTSRFNEIAPKIIVALFLIVTVIVIWFLTMYRPDNPLPEEEQNITLTENPASKPAATEKKPASPKNDAEKQEAPATPEDTPTEDEPSETEEQAQQLSFVQTAGPTSTYQLTGVEQLQLKIQTKGDSWIGVTNRQGKELTEQARVMTKGEQLDIDVSEEDYIRIRVGRTKSADIFINGEKFEYPTDLTTQNIVIEFKKEAPATS